MNPLNNMPSKLSQRQISATQGVVLSTARETSSIPKSHVYSHDTGSGNDTGTGDGAHRGPSGNWEYPSAQQLYNAMVRKGYEQSGEHVASMLAVHNYLNEGAWSQILDWERDWEDLQSHSKPSHTHAHATSEGEEGEGRWLERSLVRFEGRPGSLSPKAWIYVNLMGGYPPFDRHDWFVERPSPAPSSSNPPSLSSSISLETAGTAKEVEQGKKEEIRYVIDYYEGPPEPTGEPVFFLDIRPALDSPGAAYVRIKRWTHETWQRAKGEGGRVW